MWYSALSPYNGIEKLAGPVQTSYKAEARALLHVVRTAGVPTCIMCDCLSAVNLFNSMLMDTEQDLDKCADGELWKVIRELLKAAPANFFKCRWVPSHLNDPKHKNYAKRQQYLDDGTTTVEHIEGNGKADELAGQGVLLHAADDEALYDARIRQKLTRITQNMMVTIWRAHRAEVDPLESAEDYADLEAAAHSHTEGTAFYDDYDYNPFDDPSSHQTPTSDLPPTTHNEDDPSAAAASDAASPIEPCSLPGRFPTYPWDNGKWLYDEDRQLAIM